MNGVLAVLKPPGPTSHDVVALVRRLAGRIRVGHAGTLDPAAAGVLPLCLGPSTRLADYLHLPPKVYRFLLALGERTATLDATSAVTTAVSAAHLGPGDLEQVLSAFRGRIQQRVPLYSARRRDGVRLYAYARQGVAVEPPVVRCTVDRLALLAWRPGPVAYALCEVACSAGTYVRALCADIGEALGVGGHMGALWRLEAGGMAAGAALTVEELRAAAAAGTLSAHVREPAQALWFLPAVSLGAEEAAGVRHGRAPAPRPAPPEAAGEERVRLLDGRGRLLAVAVRRWSRGVYAYALERVLAADPGTS
jgi:tRNA pseudouridine55 synthase